MRISICIPLLWFIKIWIWINIHSLVIIVFNLGGLKFAASIDYSKLIPINPSNATSRLECKSSFHSPILERRFQTERPASTKIKLFMLIFGFANCQSSRDIIYPRSLPPSFYTTVRHVRRRWFEFCRQKEREKREGERINSWLREGTEAKATLKRGAAYTINQKFGYIPGTRIYG